MNHQFIFLSPEIDAEYMNTLYDGDIEILQSVLEEYLASIDEIIGKLRKDYSAGFVQPFKETVHKYKSTFSYAGFTSISQSMQYIENKCAFINELAELHTEFEQVAAQIENTRPVIEKEIQHLTNPS